MRLIDADAFKAHVNSVSTHWLNDWSTLGVLAAVDKQATVDPVKHGYWELEHGTYGAMRCSSCTKECPLEKATKPKYDREELLYIASDYCPWCGAKMDLESEGTDG